MNRDRSAKLLPLHMKHNAAASQVEQAIKEDKGIYCEARRTAGPSLVRSKQSASSHRSVIPLMGWSGVCEAVRMAVLLPAS